MPHPRSLSPCSLPVNATAGPSTTLLSNRWASATLFASPPIAPWIREKRHVLPWRVLIKRSLSGPIMNGLTTKAIMLRFFRTDVSPSFHVWWRTQMIGSIMWLSDNSFRLWTIWQALSSTEIMISSLMNDEYRGFCLRTLATCECWGLNLETSMPTRVACWNRRE